MEINGNSRNSYLLFSLLAVIAFSQAAHAAYNATDAVVFDKTGFGIAGLVQTPDRIYAGDDVRIRFMLQNDGTSGFQNVVLNALMPFGMQSLSYNVGSMSAGGSSPIVIDLSIPNSTKPGDYFIYLYAASQGTQVPIAEIPVTVNEQALSNAIVATIATGSDIIAGQDTVLGIDLENVGNTDAENVIVQFQTNSSGTLMPIGTDRIFVPAIAAGAKTRVDFDVISSASSTPGLDSVTFVTTYEVGKVVQPSITQTVGVNIVAQASLLLATDQDPITAASNSSTAVKVTIANGGGVAVRAVYAKAYADNFSFSGADNEYIGTLNLDDTATLSLALFPKGQLAAGTYPLTVNVSFKDASNTQRYQVKVIDVQYTGRAAGFGGLAGAGAGFTGTRTGSRPGTLFGFDYLTIGGALVVLAVAGFFGYRYYQRRKKQAGETKKK